MLGRLVGKYSDWAPLPIRLVMGSAFIAYGYPKITDIAGTAEGFATMEIPFASIFGPIVAVVEFIGGICLLLGILTRYWGLLLAIEMTVTTLGVKIPQGASFIGGGGYDLDLIFLASALALVLLGGGRLSIDKDLLKTDL